MLRYRSTEPFDLNTLASRLRGDDLVEAVLATGKYPGETLNRRVLEQPDAITFTIRARPSRELVAVFGSLPSECCDEGIAWMLCTPEVEKHSLSLMKTFPAYLDVISAPYPGLVAHMWAGNRMHVKWASRMGFMHEPAGDTFIRYNRFLKIYRPTR